MMLRWVGLAMALAGGLVAIFLFRAHIWVGGFIGILVFVVGMGAWFIWARGMASKPGATGIG